MNLIRIIEILLILIIIFNIIVIMSYDENSCQLVFIFTKNSVRIENSFSVNSLSTMRIVVHELYSSLYEYEHPLATNRSEKSCVVEWFAHNVLYKHNMFILNTKDVDFQCKESLVRRIGYYIIYILYKNNTDYNFDATHR